VNNNLDRAMAAALAALETLNGMPPAACAERVEKLARLQHLIKTLMDDAKVGMVAHRKAAFDKLTESEK